MGYPEVGSFPVDFPKSGWRKSLLIRLVSSDPILGRRLLHFEIGRHSPALTSNLATFKSKKEKTYCDDEVHEVVVGSLSMFAGATHVLAQENSHKGSSPPVAQIVALDECDPKTFNDPAPPAPGPGFCKNVALGATTPLLKLFGEAQAGTPDPNWDFEPDTLKITEGTTVPVIDQGGEPH